MVPSFGFVIPFPSEKKRGVRYARLESAGFFSNKNPRRGGPPRITIYPIIPARNGAEFWICNSFSQ